MYDWDRREPLGADVTVNVNDRSENRTEGPIPVTDMRAGL